MRPGGLGKYKRSQRDPGQVENAREGTIFPEKKGGLKMETPVETFGFRSQIEEMGFNTPAAVGAADFNACGSCRPPGEGCGL